MERRRPRRLLRSPSIHLLRARVVERARSDSQGTALRPDGPRGQPRRGRQGVLLLSRLHADALVHAVALQVSADSVSVRRPRRRERPAEQARSRVRAHRHRCVPRRPLLRRRRRVREGVARRRAHHDHGRPIADRTWRRCGFCRRSGSATRGRGATPSPSRACGPRRARPRSSPSTSRSTASAGCCAKARRGCSSPTTRPTRTASSARPTRHRSSRTASTTRWSAATSRPSTPRAAAPRRRPSTRLTLAPGASATIRLRFTDAMPADVSQTIVGADFETVRAERRAEADAFYATIVPAGTSPDGAGVMRQALGGLLVVEAVLPLRDQGVARRRSRTAAASAGAAHRAQPRVDPRLRRRRDLDAGQVGVPVVRGVGSRVPRGGARDRR